MERMYQDYRDIAEFRLVYITEAHAADGRRPVPYAKELNITEHKDYDQRCKTADQLIGDKELTIPTIIDGMDNAVNEAYKAHPDRVFLVRKDGRLAVAAKRGPFGFKPAINSVKTWLASYKETGKEPEISQKTAEAEPEPETRSAVAFTGHGHAGTFGRAVGKWNMKTDLRGTSIEATMVLSVKDGKLVGKWISQGQEMEMTDLKLEGGALSFKRSMGGGQDLVFKGIITGSKVTGEYTGAFGELECTGERVRSGHGT